MELAESETTKGRVYTVGVRLKLGNCLPKRGPFVDLTPQVPSLSQQGPQYLTPRLLQPSEAPWFEAEFWVQLWDIPVPMGKIIEGPISPPPQMEMPFVVLHSCSPGSGPGALLPSSPCFPSARGQRERRPGPSPHLQRTSRHAGAPFLLQAAA